MDWFDFVTDRALVTGGAGFIGYHLARDLLERDVEVTLVDNFFRGREDDELRALRDRVEVIDADLTIPHVLERLAGDYQAVYHLAAINGVRYTDEIPHDVLRTNLLSTIHVLDWCVRRNVETLCFSSSSEVYNGALATERALLPTPEETPLVIVDPTARRSSYAASKIAGELAVLNYARAYGLRARIVRYFNIYGPRMGHDHVIPRFCASILRRDDPFAINGPHQTRTFCHVSDAITATVAVTQLQEPDPVIVNVGNEDDEISMGTLAERLFVLAGFRPRVEAHPAPLDSPDRRRPSTAKLRTLLGYRPRVTLDQGLEQTFAWYQRAAGPH